MQHNQKKCAQEEVSTLAAGRELMEEELAAVYGGQGSTGTKNSNTLSGLGGLLNGGTLGDMVNSSPSNGLSSLTDSVKNAVPGMGGLSNLSQLLSGLGL